MLGQVLVTDAWYYRDRLNKNAKIQSAWLENKCLRVKQRNEKESPLVQTMAMKNTWIKSVVEDYNGRIN